MKRIMLGCRRLAILDVARGHQPVVSNSGALAVVINGEIYNHLELRRTHLSGERFRTLDYCERDTWAMVKVLEKLRQLASTPL